MRLFICSKEWLDDYVKEERELGHSIKYTSDSEFYYLEAVSKKLPSNIVAANKTKMEEAKFWQREHERRVSSMRRMNFIHRLFYKRGK